MFAPFSAFKKPEILDREKHLNLRIRMPENFSFSRGVDTVPLGFSELLPVSMYYPVLFGVFEEIVFPFAVLGIGGKNVYLREDGTFKIEVVPGALKEYPLGVVKLRGEGGEEWAVIVDRAEEDPEGEALFEEEGESSFLEARKTSLTELARDFEEALSFVRELSETGLLSLIPEFRISSKLGEVRLRNVFTLNIETLRRLSPEKLYYLNATGKMAVIYSVYLSVRNFMFFDLII